jgi:hypothetical protein
MNRLASLFSHRVPLYISVPVIFACGAVGYIANTLRPGSAIVGQAQIYRPPEPQPSRGAVATSPAEHATPDQKELLGASAPPGDVPSIAMPLTNKVDLVARSGRVPAKVIETAPPVLVVETMSARPRATRAVRTPSKPRRPQRMARRSMSAPTTASTGLKSIPLIGLVFSLLQ